MSPETDSASLLIVDADEFKTINDTFGHLFGDKVLREIGMAIDKNFRQNDIKGRIGGDEFVILLPGMSNTDVLHRHCLGLCRRLTRVFHKEGKHHAFSISIGAAQYPAHGQSYEELFARADEALYEAKRRGKGQYVLYQPDMSETADNHGISLAASPVPANSPMPSESIADLQARIQQMQNTITYLEKMISTLLETKK
jgi:diguanylate cyclase (GGDEF)-like protein